MGGEGSTPCISAHAQQYKRAAKVKVLVTGQKFFNSELEEDAICYTAEKVGICGSVEYQTCI